MVSWVGSYHILCAFAMRAKGYRGGLKWSQTVGRSELHEKATDAASELRHEGSTRMRGLGGNLEVLKRAHHLVPTLAGLAELCIESESEGAAWPPSSNASTRLRPCDLA